MSQNVTSSDGRSETAHGIFNMNDVVAVNGKVTVKELAAGKTAAIDADALPGTQIDVTAAANDNALTKVVTKYDQDYTADDAKGNQKKGTLHWTDTKFYSGAASTQTALGTNLRAPSSADIGLAAKLVANPKHDWTRWSLKGLKYDRAVTLVQPNRKDPALDTMVTALAADTDAYSNEGASGLTYYTANPARYLDAGNGVALFDGSKYVVYNGTGTDLNTESKLATKSIDILQDVNYNAADKNNNAVEITDIETGTSVSVTAPADTTIISKIDDNGSNTKTSQKQYVYVYGTDTDTADFIADFTAKYANKVTVQQVAKDATFTIENVTDDIRDSKLITKASGIGYYYIDGVGSDDNNYTFGATADITKEFVANAAGETTDDYTTSASWTDETVFASNEISTTVKGVAAAVEFKGETSAKVTDEDKDKETKDWSVNADVAQNAPQSVIRLRNVDTNEHLYTIDATEAANAIASGKWVKENDKAFVVLPWNTTVEGAVKVRRFFNNRTGEFLYSSDPTECAALEASSEWSGGGYAFAGVAKENGYPVRRMVGPVAGHVYCTSLENEIKPNVANGWKAEGVPFFAVETPEKEKTLDL